MSDDGKNGHDLFIVDNSDKDWKVLQYLKEWCDIAKSIDIATGFFEIGSLLALNGEWQKLEKIRILMGNEVSKRTKKALVEGISKITETLDFSIEQEKRTNHFLDGVPGIVDAMKKGIIECRAYTDQKFHAKAYITHAKHKVIGPSALVGSSNFTLPGLTDNVELNVQLRREVEELQQWYEQHWELAQPIQEDILRTIDRHVAERTPFEIYAKALQELFKGHEMTASEWDETHSKMFPVLDAYQKEAYGGLLKIARQHGGAFLCDGVGLGKTFVGLMLIERFVIRERKNVVLFAPKAAKEGVWEPHFKQWLSHVGGSGGSVDFSNLAVFSHTDLGRKGDFPERFKRIAAMADIVLIDEAHHFRNPGRRGEDDDKGPSRYYQLYDLLESPDRPKQMFMLTATPINNRLSDFRHMVELFTRRDEQYFAQTLGVNNLRAHFAQMEKDLRAKVGYDVTDTSEHATEAQEVLGRDRIFSELVVQRSRAYAKESQIREKGQGASFPDRKPPQVAAYSIRKTYGKLLEMFEKAFTRKNPLFTLPMYYPLHWYKGDDSTVDAFEENRQKQVIGLIRTNFLKRFESSVAAFELSCDRLLQKLLAFVEVHSQTDSEKKILQRWKTQNSEILGYAVHRQLELWGHEKEEDEEEDIVPPEMLEAVERLDPAEYRVDEMIQEALLDMDQIIQFLSETRKFQAKHDDKLQKLIRLLKSKELQGQKALIFTEFADTARYLLSHLKEADIDGVEQVDSATKGSRAETIRRFSPYYNGSSSGELEAAGVPETRILISTDVLSEGLNLQDASRMINYDIHWNPVRLMQRIGRVDRRMNPEIEKRLIEDHPEMESSRGKVSFWNFLPPEELNEILTLYTRVTQKTLLISKTFGIEGRKLLTPDDDYEALKEFVHAYEGTRTILEAMHLEYQEMTKADPELDQRLRDFPLAVFSGKKKPAKGLSGIFLCYSLPALDKETGEFSEEAGFTQWYFFNTTNETILTEPSEIVASIRSKTDTPWHCSVSKKTLSEIRERTEKHIKNTYLKQVQAPIGVKPVLKCWMELS